MFASLLSECFRTPRGGCKHSYGPLTLGQTATRSWRSRSAAAQKQERPCRILSDRDALHVRVEVRGIEPLASTVRLLRSAN